MRVQFAHPRLAPWQTRLARVPRWAWLAVFIGVILPLLTVGIVLVLAGILTGLLILGVVVLVVAVLGLLNRLRYQRKVDDGRRNVKIIVQSARVIDR